MNVLLNELKKEPLKSKFKYAVQCVFYTDPFWFSSALSDLNKTFNDLGHHSDTLDMFDKLVWAVYLQSVGAGNHISFF